MSEDRLEEIKRDIVNNAGSWDIIDSDDVIWLMSELEKSREEIAQLEKRDKQVEIAILATRQQRDDEFNRAEKYKIELEKSKAENKELQVVFDLQATRTKKAEKMWQQATGKHDTLPDLGVLLDWLMGEIKRLNKMQPIANVTLSDDAKHFEGLAEKQRRHRKWAIKEARHYLHFCCDWLVDQTLRRRTEKAEAEVKRLKSLLSYQGTHF